MILQSITNNSQCLKIEYMLGNVCNFKCNYCFPGSNEGDKPWPNYQIAIKNFKHLLSKYNKQVRLYFVGGEPTLWKEFPKFCKELKENFNVIISMSTNGSRKLSWWEKNWQYFDIVNVSVHHEFSNVTQTKKLLDFLYDKKIECNADVLMDYKDFNKCVSIVEELKQNSKPWTIVAKPVLINGKTHYILEQETYFQDTIKRYPPMSWYNEVARIPRNEIIVETHTENFVIHDDGWFALNNLNNFKGWYCNLGVDIIKIDPKGIIHGNCGEYLYNEKFKYNLYDKNFIDKFNPTIAPVICSKNICPCSGEAGITKWRNYAQL